MDERSKEREEVRSQRCQIFQNAEQRMMEAYGDVCRIEGQIEAYRDVQQGIEHAQREAAAVATESHSDLNSEAASTASN